MYDPYTCESIYKTHYPGIRTQVEIGPSPVKQRRRNVYGKKIIDTLILYTLKLKFTLIRFRKLMLKNENLSIFNLKEIKLM